MGKFFALLVLLALFLTGCRPVPVREPTPILTTALTPTPTVALAKAINLNLGREPSSIDPALAVEAAEAQVDELLFLGLTDIDDETGEAIPELAIHWDVSKDGLTWTFHMRRDAYWVRYNPETGQVEKLRPVTAHDVEYGVKRSLDPATKSESAYILYIIKNAEIGVKAIDDYAVQFTLERPAGYFPTIVRYWVARPQPREAIEQHGRKWIEPGKILTNGPYVITAWEHGSSMVMRKNPYYYGAEEVSIQRINWVMVEDASQALRMYEMDELDAVEVPEEEFEKVRTDSKLSEELHIVPRPCTYYYGFTTIKPPFNDPLVRRAFSAAIDRQGLIKEVLKGPQRPANSFTSPGIFGSVGGDPEVAPWALDYELGKRKAREWLAKAGYRGGEGFPQVILMHNTGERQRKIAQAIATMWEKALGIKVKIADQDWKIYIATLRKDSPLEEVPHIWRLGWCECYPDPDDFLRVVFHSQSAENFTRWRNKGFDKLVEEAAEEVYPARRRELYKEAEKILCDEEAAIAPIYFYAQAILTKPWVERTYSPLRIEHIEKWRIKATSLHSTAKLCIIY